jgi:hypothetical protein
MNRMQQLFRASAPRRIVPILACVLASGRLLPEAAAQTSVPTSRPVLDALQRVRGHLHRVQQRLGKYDKLDLNPYIRLDLSIADRFIDRIQTGRGKGDAQLEWKILQTDEIDQVLADAEKTMDRIDAGELPPEGLGPVPMPTGGAVKIVDGVFVTDTVMTGAADPGEPAKPRPYYFGGYGHFQQIVNDLPNFNALGVSLVQDGRNGPAQGLAKDHSLTPAGLDIKDTLAKAAKANVKVDILTSPHYFPAWAVAEAPDMQNGSAFHNIDHPKEREIIQTWLTKVAQRAKGEPALLSYCLSNEPVYSASGRDQYSAPAWHAFLKDRHKTIDALNALYQTQFKSFEEVPAGGWKDDPIGRRRAYDWVCFNDLHFAQWHKWMGDVLKKQNPGAFTHAKIMVFFTLDQDKAGWGIDPEQFCLATDIAGCDAYAQLGVGVGPLDESTSKEYAYNWQVEEMCYDLLHSFNNQPVFNSENHPLPNATGAYRWPAKHTYANFWQGGLHHQGATTTWVWEEAASDALLHSIYFRPAHIAAQGRAMLDLNRLSPEVTAINRAKPTVAILYSPASRFWQKDYALAMRTVYTALNFRGETVTFVSERQLAEGSAPDVKTIVLPHATHVTNATAAALKSRRIICVGDDCAAFDEYGRARPQSQRPTGAAGAVSSIKLGTEREVFDALPVPAGLRVTSEDGAPAWGVEFRAIEHEGATLVPIINLLKKPQKISIKIEHGGDEAIELISRKSASLKQIELKPMEPMLLKINRP